MATSSRYAATDEATIAFKWGTIMNVKTEKTRTKAEVARDIAETERQMMFREMTDDFFHSNGGYAAYSKALRDLRAEMDRATH